eukprot:Lithocolla_globosa_v1_NODE_7634_length_921_cov_2.180139.p2 type:complete len:111 gc:universal NODE_7634_length_921_cov_2.180139:127-459(+)
MEEEVVTVISGAIVVVVVKVVSKRILLLRNSVIQSLLLARLGASSITVEVSLLDNIKIFFAPKPFELSGILRTETSSKLRGGTNNINGNLMFFPPSCFWVTKIRSDKRIK